MSRSLLVKPVYQKGAYHCCGVPMLDLFTVPSRWSDRYGRLQGRR